MGKIKDIVRFIFISPEVIIGLLVFIVLYKFQSIPIFISKYIFADTMDWKLILLAIPIPMIKYIYSFGDEILNPGKDSNREKLKTFPKYWMLKNRIYYSLLIAVISFLVTLFAFYCALTIDKTYGTIILLTAWSVVLVCFVTVALAKLSIKDILY